MKAKGVPVESLPAESLKETSYLTAGFGSVAVMNRAPHPNATKLYLDWMLSKSGQEDLVKVTSYPSRRLDASAAGLPESVSPKRGVHYQDSASEATSKVKSEVVDYLRSILPG
jgi:ABC-type Fe3+ transport system substrate-binding protein